MSSTINRAYETNNYSIISKYSASRAGYCKDEILEDFVENWLDKKSNSKGRRRTPLVNRGYAARMLAMDWAIDRAILNDGVNCFIVLGAGFDTTSLRRTNGPNNNNNCHWIEIDLPQVIETKCSYIKSKCQLDDSRISSPGEGITSFSSIKCHLISCDLTNQLDLQQKLSLLLASTTLAFEASRKVCLVNEVCLCYLDEQVRARIFHTITSTLSASLNATKLTYLGFEQVKSSANSEMAEIMTSHFDKIGHPLEFFPTRQEMRAHYFERCQFQALTVLPMYQVYHNILQPKRAEHQLDTLEPFDEFEEMDLYLSHYALVMGRIRLDYPADTIITGTGEDESMSDLCSELASTVHISNHQVRKVTNCDAVQVRRYGHAACVLEDTANVQVALLSGGFGDLRLDDCQLITQDNSKQTVRSLPFEGGDDSDNPAGRMYGQVCRLPGEEDDVLLLFNGGRTSPLKRPNALNLSCIYRLHEDKLSFVCSILPHTSLRWRHRLVKSISDQVIQAGGICGLAAGQPRSAPLIVWNFSSDKLGHWQVPALRDLEQFERHSFGMSASESGHQLLVFGGLQSAGESLDRPAHSALLYDLRNSSGAPELTLDHRTQVYGHQVHFINEHQFVRVGGVSSESGLPEIGVELFDLRAVGQHRVASFEVPPDNTRVQDDLWMPINLDSLNFKHSGQIVTYGGGGNYFTFGTTFNSTRLVYSYARNSI